MSKWWVKCFTLKKSRVRKRDKYFDVSTHAIDYCENLIILGYKPVLFRFNEKVKFYQNTNDYSKD